MLSFNCAAFEKPALETSVGLVVVEEKGQAAMAHTASLWFVAVKAPDTESMQRYLTYGSNQESQTAVPSQMCLLSDLQHQHGTAAKNSHFQQ